MDKISDIRFIQSVSLIGLSFLGFVFSLLWLMANKGSKFWQKNWEQHVALLENDVMGPLYKTHLDENSGSKIIPLEEYDFSLSRVNMIISLFVVFSAASFFTWNLHHYFFDLICFIYCKDWIDFNVYIRTILVSLAILATSTWLLMIFCHGNKKRQNNDLKFIHHEFDN